MAAVVRSATQAGLTAEREAYYETAGVRAVCPALMLLTVFDGVAGLVDRKGTNPLVSSAALTLTLSRRERGLRPPALGFIRG
jgi:hypothetical protein